MIEMVILYILNKYDATIYRVSKIIDEFFFAYLKSSSGTINPAIKRLEKMALVECSEKITDGGMLSKIYSITPLGKKHLSELLLSFNSQNPYHVLNEARIAIYCSDVLSISELISFKENMQNVLELHKIKLENGLKNEYIDLNDIQKEIIKKTISETSELIGLL